MTTAPKRSQPILFSVRESARFPRSLWERFTAHAEQRQQPWIDLLRHVLERYLDSEGTPRREHRQP